MRIRLLPSTLGEDGSATDRQHYSCILVNESVAIDAGCLANAVGEKERKAVRDVVLTHAHLDHIAGLPLFIDDLFATLTEPVRVHAGREVIDILEEHVFNWHVYPRFSELSNKNGKVIEYLSIEDGKEFVVCDLRFTPVAVNHKVPSMGFVVSDGGSTFALTGDTAEMDDFWKTVNAQDKIDLLLIECAFPDEFDELAAISHHLTPKKLAIEIAKFSHLDCPIRVINIKPGYRDTVVHQLGELNIERLEVFEIGRDHEI
jgi:cAMP phosphodiesterase